MSRLSRFHCLGLPVSCFLLSAGPAGAETLKDALTRAYRTNPTLSGARAVQRATDEQVMIERADGLPDVRVSGQYNESLHREASTRGGVLSPRRDVSATAALNVPIYSGGAVRNAVKGAKLRVEAGRNDLRATESAIFSQVVAAYLDVIRDSAIVSLNQQNVRALEVNRQATNDRFEVGDLTRTDVAQSEARLAIAYADLQNSEAQFISSKERYIAIVGSPPEGLEAPPPLPGLPANPEEALAVALRDNPDILAANKARDAARSDVRVAKAQAAPRLSGFVQGNYLDYLGSENDGTTALSRLESSNKQAVAGVSLVVPLYQGGRPGALARQSVARESRAIEDAIATERDVIAQTRSAFASWQASLQSIESTRKAVSASSLSLEGVKAENSVGTRTIIDILDAEREALNAQVQFVTAQRNAYVAGFTLLASMGHAEARDLNLDDGPLYDPVDNYKRVRSKFLDWQFDPAPKPQATRTADTPTQTSVQIPGALDTLLPVAAERVSVPTPASTSGNSPRK